MSSAAGPLSSAASDVGGAKVHAVGFAATDACNAVSAAWSSTFDALASDFQNVGTNLTSTNTTYQNTEGAIVRSFLDF